MAKHQWRRQLIERRSARLRKRKLAGGERKEKAAALKASEKAKSGSAGKLRRLRRKTASSASINGVNQRQA
jgi:hypothetical protein